MGTSRAVTDSQGSIGQRAVVLLRTRGVVSGMIAMLLLGISVMTPGFVPNSGLDQIGALKLLRMVLKWGVGHLLLIASLVLLLRSWLALRPAVNKPLNHTAILVLWSLPILLAPPIFSSDAFLYADQGWILHLGLNPYEVGLTEAGGPFRANVHPVWRGTTAIYPPLALESQYLMAWLTGFGGLTSVIAMRVPALIGVAIIALFVPRVARQLGVDVETAKWFGTINPLILIHYVGGMHNDAMMIALVLVAVWAAYRFGLGGMLVGSVLVGVGAAFKQPGLAAAIAVGLIPVAPRLPEMKLGRRIVTMALWCGVALGLALATFVAIAYATGLGFGWTRATNIGELTWGMSPASMAEQLVGWILPLFGIHHGLLPFFSRVTTVLSLVGAVFFAWRYFFADKILTGRTRNHSHDGNGSGVETEHDRSWRDHPVRWLAWSFASLGFSGAGFHVWYLIWSSVYVGMLRYGNRVLRMFVGVMIVFITVEGGLEYFGIRPLIGYLLGAAFSWLFWANSAALRIVPDERALPAAETSDEAAPQPV